MKRYLIIPLAVLLFCFVECKKAERLNADIVGLGGDVWEQTELDKWILTNFTEPYNISVKYRWDGSEYNVEKTLVPSKLNKVQPLLEVIRTCWIDSYAAEVDQNFIKRFAPKQYVLIGSLRYNSNGTHTLGEAEGGIKVTLFNVNNFDKSNRMVTKNILLTIHHEFAHILHQTIMFQKEFPLITKDYTADWNNQKNYESKGFISQYAQASPEEDFVEMIAIMLTEGKIAYEMILSQNSSATAVSSIRAKEQLVTTYFKQTWGIDFYRLQNRVQKAINAVAPNNPADFLGYKKTFTSLNNISPDNLPDLSPDFINVYNTAKAGLDKGGSKTRRILDNISISYPAANQLALKVNFYDNAEKKYNTSTFTYKITTNDDGSVKLELIKTDDPKKIASDISGLTDYLTKSAFVYKMYYSSDLTNEYIGLAKATDPTSFFYGVAGN